MSKQRWRVDVKGFPITVDWETERDHLQLVNAELAQMKLALHRILGMNADEWGKQGIWMAQKIAYEGLVSSTPSRAFISPQSPFGDTP